MNRVVRESGSQRIRLSELIDFRHIIETGILELVLQFLAIEAEVIAEAVEVFVTVAQLHIDPAQ